MPSFPKKRAGETGTAPSLETVDAAGPAGGARRWLRPVVAAVVPLALVAGGYYALSGTDGGLPAGTTFVARKGTLPIMVVEGGKVTALEQQEVKSEVEGTTKILSIVPEGYSVTQEDVDGKKVLCELDSKELRDKAVAKELEYQDSLAAFTQAKEEYGIQVNQNRSDQITAELAVKFARTDFIKYMGAEAGEKILKNIPMPEDEDVPLPTNENEDLAPADTTPDSNGGKPEDKQAGGSPSVTAEPPREGTGIDFSKYADAETMGDGDAGQRMRTLEDNALIAKRDMTLAKTTFEGTKRLAAKEFMTKLDVEAEEVKVARTEVAVRTADVNKDLFLKYEFPKAAETYLSNYLEACQKLIRAKKLAKSKLAQAEAKLKSTEARFTLQTQKRKELREQTEKCKIVAKHVGLVVYGGGDDWRGDDRIEEGAMVRERQKIITIPDMTQMAVEIKVHESYIKRIQKGQKARIRIEAYPEEELRGEVVKLAVLPDSQNRWMNPDIMVYQTTVSIEGVHPWLRPQMTAEVEILVKELPDVIYVPIQAVMPSNGERACFVVGLTGQQRRVVETGEENDQFIEIKKGLSEGEEVLLRAPVSTTEETPEKPKANADKSEDANDGGKNAHEKESGDAKEPVKRKPREEKPGAAETHTSGPREE